MFDVIEKEIIDGFKSELITGRIPTYEDVLMSDYVMQVHDVYLAVQLILDTYIPDVKHMSKDELLSETIRVFSQVFCAYPDVWVVNGRYLRGNEPADCEFLIRFPTTGSNAPAQAMWEFEYKNGKILQGPCGAVSMELKKPVRIVYERAGDKDFPDFATVCSLVQKQGVILEKKQSPRDCHMSRIIFQHQEGTYYLFYLLQILAEGVTVCNLFVSDEKIGFLQARHWFSRPHTNTSFQDVRKLKMMMHLSGSGSLSPRVSIPAFWAKTMGVTKEDRAMDVSFNGDEIIIRKCKK